MILCGGSAADLPVQTPLLARHFNVVDSFDTHARIPRHFEAVDEAAKEGNKVGIISVGWDPGMFSLNRLYGESILPGGHDYTFWGRGVSRAIPMRSAGSKVSGMPDSIPFRLKKPSKRSAAEKKSRTVHQREAYPRMFCSGGRECGFRPDQERNRIYAQLFCRL